MTICARAISDQRRAIRHYNLVNFYFLRTFCSVLNYQGCNTSREAAEHVVISHTGIINCCNGKNKTAAGYVWKYESIL